MFACLLVCCRHTLSLPVSLFLSLLPWHCSPEVIGDANGYALTGNTTQQALVQNFLDILYENHTYATGGSNDFEWWHPPRTLGDSMNDRA